MFVSTSRTGYKSQHVSMHTRQRTHANAHTHTFLVQTQTKQREREREKRERKRREREREERERERALMALTCRWAATRCASALRKTRARADKNTLKLWVRGSRGLPRREQLVTRARPIIMMTNAVQNPSELVCIVDEANQVVGSATRREMRAENLIHRCSYCLIFDDDGKLFVQKRVDFKETYPSFYDPAPGGVVGHGESYEVNCQREIEEEMGVVGVKLEHHFDFFFKDSCSRVWGRLFSCKYNGPFKLQETEVESAEFMDIEEVKKLLEKNIVCPDSALAIKRFYKLEE